MSDTTTPNYGFDLPTVGASQDTWGGKLNANWVAADSAIHNLASGYLPIGGGTVGGNLLVTGTLGVSGTFTAAGNADVNGSLVVAGGLGAASITTSGPVSVGGALSAPSGAVSGNLTVGTASLTGTLTGVTGSFSGQLNAGSINSNGGYFYVAGNPNFYLRHNPSTGAWTFVENGVTNATLDTGGNLSAIGNIQAGAHVAANGGNMYMGAGGSGSVFQFQPSWYWNFTSANGDLIWETLAGELWHMRTGDSVTYNGLGAVGGMGAYWNMSDARGKHDVADSPLGLAEILRLRPVTFKRTSRANTELGFIAQELREVIPEAVVVAGIELPDGMGGIDSSDPTLATTLDPIVATLVNAIKELTARVADLEALRLA